MKEEEGKSAMPTEVTGVSGWKNTSDLHTQFT